jgi:signal transduction histidine kinase/ligand-binding sensor domain-containing protein
MKPIGSARNSVPCRRGPRAVKPVAAAWNPLERRLVGALLLAAAAAFSGATAARALDPATPLANLAHQSWTTENGLPQNTVQALAQTRDGFLWLGVESGLVRFDGISFQDFDASFTPALQGSDVRCLLAAGDGALWIGSSAGLVRWKEGVATVFTTRDGVPDAAILAIRLLADGRIALWTGLGAAVQTGNRFAAVENLAVFPRLQLPSPQEPSDAAVFEAQLPDGVHVVGAQRFLALEPRGKTGSQEARLTVGRELPGSRIQAILADREGTLWVGTNAGLVRWRQGKVERFPVTESLATASILALMEDAEGDLWAGTETDGLHILRDRRFHTLDEQAGLSSNRITTVVEDNAGVLWAGTDGAGLNALSIRPANTEAARHSSAGSLRRISATQEWRTRRTFTVAQGLASNVILSLAAAPNGDLWVGTPDGLNRIRAGRVDTFTSADGLPDDFIRSLLIDTDGSLWVATRRGLTHWAVSASAHGSPLDAAMKTYTHADGLGSDLVGAMVRDPGGALWVATFAGLTRFQNGAFHTFTTRDGLPGNVITALASLPGGTLLVGTQNNGWASWDGKQFHAAPPTSASTAVHAILADAAGRAWIATADGIERCDRPAGGAAPPRCIRLGTADGLRSRETAINSHPSAWRSRDGLLWFATPKGLVFADPAHFPLNLDPPKVALERFLVDDASQALLPSGAALRIRAGHVHFEFDYAGLSFASPLKVRYRYRLEGFDRDWTNAGARRSAYYTNIPPGRYVFRVQASNNDGEWSGQGAALPFELRPHFYQTLWFYALLLVLAAGAVVLLLRLQMRQAQREFHAVLGERSRIAREIHDTLAQGYASVSIQLELMAEFLQQHKVQAATAQLDRLRGYVREGLADARQSIWALRTQDAEDATLPIRLRRIAQAAADGSLAASFKMHGAYRPLTAEMEQEILRVAQEAIHNVGKHAAASEMTVRLEYRQDAVEVEVSDNGCGGAEPRAGGYGMKGMEERARCMGGSLQLSSKPGQGTSVCLRVPVREAVAEPAGEAQ